MQKRQNNATTTNQPHTRPDVTSQHTGTLTKYIVRLRGRAVLGQDRNDQVTIPPTITTSPTCMHYSAHQPPREADGAARRARLYRLRVAYIRLYRMPTYMQLWPIPQSQLDLRVYPPHETSPCSRHSTRKAHAWLPRGVSSVLSCRKRAESGRTLGLAAPCSLRSSLAEPSPPRRTWPRLPKIFGSRGLSRP